MLQLELPGATDAGDGRKIRLLRPLASQTRDAVSRHNSTAQAAWRRKMLRQSCQEKSRTEACSPMVAMIQYYAGCWFGSRILLSLFIFSLCDEPCRLQVLYFCGECLPTRVVQISSDSIRFHQTVLTDMRSHPSRAHGRAESKGPNQTLCSLVVWRRASKK